MSMPPPPPHSPGPYGPPQYPNPPGGRPYAQQQGYPGPPHPPQPYPGQAPWGPLPVGPAPMGAPPMGPPPRKSRAGIVIAVVAIALGGLFVAGFVVNRIARAGAVVSGAGFPAAEYRLTVPKTVLSGTYRLSQDASGTKGKEIIDGGYDPKVRDPKPVVAQYATADSATEPGVLVISGMYGQFKDHADSRRKMIAGAQEGDGAGQAVPPRDITPTGSDITLTCQVLTSLQNGTKVPFPMCAWADANTAATVAVVTAATALQDPASIDLDRMAETTLKVRAESRQPLH
ncbi:MULTISPECIES: hypothetical protein [unclassified Streptomyces]|uniref:hypothetical protein n=1 Tax=unclassified Streptomyces TaxID=2593676 RepID=UPI002E32192A|nr:MULTISPECIES: hypothetical protein [unclassified Streptomyces]WUC65196.1 hypothetical protein OG861_13605 [Streptomyces sp. NBC_00539]